MRKQPLEQFRIQLLDYVLPALTSCNSLIHCSNNILPPSGDDRQALQNTLCEDDHQKENEFTRH